MKRLLPLVLLAFASIQASAQCTATFTSTNNDPVFTFTNTTAGNVDFTSWDFGDGTQGVGLTATHSYSSNGTYLVCLTSIDSVGMVACTFCDSVVVNNGNPASCSANFTYNYSTFTNTYAFTGTATGTAPYTFYWDFGDGNFSTQGNPNHQYAGTGPYLACLTITDNLGCSSTYCDSVGSAGPTCQASMNYTLDTNNNVTFTGTSTGPGPYTYFWNFGDGSSSTQATPTHFYNNGTYSACVTVTDGNGCSSTTCDSVYVNSGSPAGCNAFFYAYDDTSQVNTIFIYNMSSGAAPISYFWDFGDGNTSTQAFPTHTYSQLGTYLVCLTITDGSALGCSSTYCDSVSMTARMNGFTINIVDPSGTSSIEENLTESISLFPNPVSEEMTIRWEELQGAANMAILDASGRVVRELAPQNANDGEITINLSEVASGYYMLRLQTGMSSKSIPFIKK